MKTKSLAVALIALSLGAATAHAAAPIFKTNLTNKTAAVGTSVTFSVASTNASVEAWYFQSTNVLSGSGFTYTIASAAKSDAGDYTAVITNASGSVTSAVSTLNVLIAPSITQQPVASVVVPVGATTNLTAAANGDSLAWQWFKDGKGVAGATSTSLSLASLKATDSGKYWAVATNLVGKATSSTNTLTVVPPPVMSTPPKSQALLVGQNLNLAVVAKGAGAYTNLTYQWLVAGTNLSGATDASYSVTNVTTAAAGDYSVVVANAIASLTSAVAKITVAADTKSPVFTVTLPKTVTNTSYTLTGKTKDDVAVTNLTYTLTGTNFTAITSTNGWASWSADITFKIGSNTLSLIATDYSGNAVTNTASVFCAPFYDVTVITNGSGTGTLTGVTNRMQYAGVYTLTAKADPKNLFLYWTISGVSTNTATNASKITFTVTNNVTVAATFGTNMFLTEAGQYNGLFYPAGAVSHDSVGFLSATVTTNLLYSGKVLINGTSVGISGQLTTNGVGSATLGTNGTLQFGLSGSQQLTGTVSSANWTSVLTADLAVFSKLHTQSNFVGTFTVAIPPGTNGPATAGYGYAVVTVDPSGTVKLVGSASDGSALSQSAPISVDGFWPLFVPLYPASKTNTTGEIFGWIQFPTNGTPTGTVIWEKPADSAKIYGNGLTNIVNIISSVFTAPSKSDPKTLDNMVFGITSFKGGNLTNNISDWVFMGGNGSVYCYDNNTSMKISSSGLISGKFLHNGTGKPANFSGVVMQNNTNAFGYFLGTNCAGSVTLVPYP